MPLTKESGKSRKKTSSILFLKGLRKSMRTMLQAIDKRISIELGKTKDQAEFDLDNPRLPSKNEKILRIAQYEIGVKEVQGSGNNPKVVEYHRYASKNNRVEQPDDVPWCSSFVCYLAEKSGMQSTNSMMARSWLKWGTSVKEEPAPGDIVVYWRGNKSGWKGHVGIFLGTNRNGSIITLGGNQSDEVNITAYSPDKLLDIRRSSLARIYDDQDIELLDTLAQSMISGIALAGMKKNGKVT